MINSRNKGAQGERELANWLTARGYTARRGQQHAGGQDSPDIVCDKLRDFHHEVKRVERLNLDAAITQAQNDGDGKPWLVWHRKNRGDWRVTLDAEVFLVLVDAFIAKP